MIGSPRFVKGGRLAVAIGVVVAVLGAAPSVDAALGPQASPSLVEYSGKGIGNISLNGGTVQIIVGGQAFYGVASTFSSSCTANNQTLDTVKVWTSMGQAALLAVKQVKVYFTACGGFNYINVLDIVQ